MTQYLSLAASVGVGHHREPCAPPSPPNYDRSALRPAVVHIGLGQFHRAHQAVYLDELASDGHTGWGVVGVAVHSRAVAEALAAQDNLFTVVERDADQVRARTVGVLVDVLVLADDPGAVRRRLADPATRLVTLTITGDGYACDEAAVQAGQSVFATLVAGLADRRAAGLPGLTVLSCDNIPDNGPAARRAAMAFAAVHGDGLAGWIAENVTFPASMVDRITPAVSEQDREWVREHAAVDDRCPVLTETFAQWVVEDNFAAGRPPLERVGVRFVDDVSAHKLIKNRMLNAAHSCLAYLGYLAGYRTGHEAMADPLIARFVDRLLAEEIAPLLPAGVPGMHLEPYRRMLNARLANPAVGDQLSRLGRRGTTKMRDYVLPSLHEARRQGQPHQLLTVVLAAWLRYLRGVDLAGESIDIVDPRAATIAAAALMPLDNGVRTLLRDRCVFGDLIDDRAFVRRLLRMVRRFDERGLSGAVSAVLQPAAPADDTVMTLTS